MISVLFLIISLLLKQEASVAATEAEKERPVLGKVPAFLAEEEALLTSYGEAFRKAGKKYGEKVLQNLEVLPHGLHQIKQFVPWVMKRFPERDYKDLFSEQDRFVRVPVLRDLCLDRMGEHIEKMLTHRRTFAEKYGNLFLVLDKESERLTFRAQADEHMRQNQEKPKTAFITEMALLEGEAIAQARWHLVQAQRAKKMLDHNLEALGATEIAKEIDDQIALLRKAPLRKISLIKLEFYRTAFTYFYKNDLTAFLGEKKGIESLWKHLSKRKEEGDFDGLEDGKALCSFLESQRIEYNTLFSSLSKWLDDIREERTEDPKKSILRALVDKQETLNLKNALDILKTTEKERLYFIIRKDAELIAKVPELDQSSEELQSAVTDAEADLDKAYEDAVKDWFFFKKGPMVLALGWAK